MKDDKPIDFKISKQNRMNDYSQSAMVDGYILSTFVVRASGQYISAGLILQICR
ncbi:MAG: hypothetical protein IPP49_18930 [Saprospiraceae bacterium]|nr:hypothetical protein [Saprospiraceae bacterium]